MKTWTKGSFFATVTCAVAGAYWLYEKRRISLDTVGGAARPSEYELKLVQVLFRHGARTPLKSLPGTLQLCAKVHALPDPRGLAKTVYGIVTVFTSEAETEVLYPNYTRCDHLKQMTRQRIVQASLLPEIAEDLKEMYKLLEIPEHERINFIDIWDDMASRKAHDLARPSSVHYLMKIIEKRAVETVHFAYEPSNSTSLQLCVGQLLSILIGNIENKLKDQDSLENLRKLHLYSVHDTTLMPFLMALDIFDMKWPPYSADAILELYEHRSSKEAFVKVSYLGKCRLKALHQVCNLTCCITAIALVTEPDISATLPCR
ncbi:PPA6 phosphatase, partial [Polypterus senegalus]